MLSNNSLCVAPAFAPWTCDLAKANFAAGVEVVVGDLLDIDAMRALAGVKTSFVERCDGR